MRIVRSLGWLYLVGDLWWHKSFEVGVQRVRHGDDVRGFALRFSLTTRGDHAGLAFSVALAGTMLEINVYDRRHWNWLEGRWMLPGEQLPQHPPVGELDLSWMA